jgi:hypothetical protein
MEYHSVGRRARLVPRSDGNNGRAAMSLNYVVLEAWSQGFLVGGLIILVLITLANIRKGVLLHKLILLEVCTPPRP